MGPAIAIDRLNELAEVWSAAMLRATWQGGVLIAAAWALANWRRGPSPRVACWFWRLADLKLFRAQLKIAEAGVKQAQAQAEAAAARREYCDKQFQRIASLVERRAVEGRLLDEEEDRRQVARAEERASQHRVETARAELDKARAEVREAEALRDIVVAEGRSAPDARAMLRSAQIRLREARLDVARAEADRAGATATVTYRTRQVRRLESLVAVRAIEQRLVDEQEAKLTVARKAEQAAAAVEQAGARLKAVEADRPARPRGN